MSLRVPQRDLGASSSPGKTLTRGGLEARLERKLLLVFGRHEASVWMLAPARISSEQTSPSTLVKELEMKNSTLGFLKHTWRHAR